MADVAASSESVRHEQRRQHAPAARSAQVSVVSLTHQMQSVDRKDPVEMVVVPDHEHEVHELPRPSFVLYLL